MIGDYCNQSLIWKHVIDTNDYNEPAYSTSTIKGRLVEKSSLIRNKEGVEVVSSGIVYTASAVQVDDLVDGGLVVRVESMVGLDGDVEGYKVFLE